MAISKINSNSIAPSQTLVTPVISGLMDLQGGQIKFPASQIPSSDGNTLDDYEEGTWTPISGTNISVQHAKYTKIGNVVTVACTIIHTGAITSYDRIDLPFSPNASGEMRYTGTVQFFEAGTGTTVVNVLLLTQSNSSPKALFWGQSGSEQWAYSMAYSAGNGINQYTFSMTYFV